MPTMAAGPAPPTDQAPAVGSAGMMPIQSPPLMVMSDAFAKDAIIAWFRGEFAAANAIIDSLCGHLTQLTGTGVGGGAGRGEGSEYEAVFTAIHRRRLNWIPVLQMQKYHSIADVAVELRKVAEKKAELKEGGGEERIEEINDYPENGEVEVQNDEKITKNEEKIGAEEAAVVEEDDSPNSDITDAGAKQGHVCLHQIRDSKTSVANFSHFEFNVPLDNDRLLVGMFPRFKWGLRYRGRRKGLAASAVTLSYVDVSVPGNVCNDFVAGDYDLELGSQEVQPATENIDICSKHEDCDARRSQIKLTKGFSAKEHVKGHMANNCNWQVNVVKGLKLYEDVFADSELSKLIDFVSELRLAGQNGELSGESFILFNKQVKGNRKELIQLGVPIFRQIIEEATGDNQMANLEPISALLQSVIDHLVQWQIIPEYKRPNGCIINFFDEGEHSQPFLKPPHLDQPISTLLLSESTMAFGRTLVSDKDGNYKGPLMLSLKEGSLIVMRGNSADTARHVMCPSPNKRISITFFRVRPDSNQSQSPPTTPTSPLNGAMTLWQPSISSPYPVPNGAPNSYEAMDVMPKWGVLRAPVVMLAPVRPMVLNPRRMPRGGTGVFLPWTVGSRKPSKHLPPRAQKGRLLTLPSPVETLVEETASEPGINIEG
ncbi:hypothetical protein JRO89_XS01G0257800 [Xanthoceras sorbifolium]|uniref:Fe2OG dioxygenase domain-containing protein n=1 Tax=Xanthoceras sorbifolium TaxID=99658 RepID=A0ABQ8ILA9_9ROSI|nr:hypothetical protein JRO89_XS01G0257800 [Xanthoceras sorbifolium]